MTEGFIHIAIEASTDLRPCACATPLREAAHNGPGPPKRAGLSQLITQLIAQINARLNALLNANCGSSVAT